MIENFSLIKNFLKFDEWLLIYINNSGNPFMDKFWIYITRMESWFSAYILLVILFYHIWGWKKSIFIIFFIALLILSLDKSASFFKYTFKRYRPCYNPILASKIRLIENICKGHYSFFSSHSANHFALSIFLKKFFSNFGKYINFILIFWALLVSYSRIYFAVHYPSDVIFGIIAGIFFGYIFREICYKTLYFLI